MQLLDEREDIGITAVRRLRKEKHEMGFPFMINVTGLPKYECYFEYSDGTIYLMKLIPSKRDFEKIRKLTSEEATDLLIANNLNV